MSEELIAEARQNTKCRCVDAPEQDCNKHGDWYARLIGELADALEVAEAKCEARTQRAQEWQEKALAAEAALERVKVIVEGLRYTGPEDAPRTPTMHVLDGLYRELSAALGGDAE